MDVSEIHFVDVMMVRGGRLAARLQAVLAKILHVPSNKKQDLRSKDKEIARNRLLLGGATIVYAWIMLALGDIRTAAPVEISLVYLTISIVAFATTQYSWYVSVRRHLLLGIDISVVSAGFIVAGPLAAPLLFLYTWITLGYGFRYGIYYLRLAALGSLCGLLVALLWTNYWQTQPFVSSGWLMLAIVIPPYFELLLRRTISASQAAEDATHSKVLMLAGLGQSMRAPVNAILVASKALNKGGLDLQQREALDAISTAAYSVIKELDDFLDVSRIDAGRMRTEITKFGLKQALEEVIRVEGARASTKGVALSWFINPDVPLHVWSERRCLIRAVSNIVENAVKFTSAGSVLITVRLHKALRGNPSLCFEILDTGIGIKQEARQKIFESFTQATPEMLHLFGGSGLGLAVARRMVNLLGGEIKVNSVEGKGSMFWFNLPIAISETPVSLERKLVGNAVIILSPQTEALLPFAARIERFGAKTHLSNHAGQWSTMIGDGLDDIEHIVVIVDGRYADASEIAHSLRRGGLLSKVPFVLLDAGMKISNSTVRRQFLTAINVASSDRELVAALYLAGATGEKAMTRSDNEATHGSVSSPQASRQAMHVLIADNNRTSLAVISKVLEVAGHTYKAVDDSDRALDAFEHEAFDLVFIEVDHPTMDGLEATKMIRFMQVGRRYTPIYGITSREGVEMVTRWKDAGLDGTLAQPVDPRELLKIVDQFLSNKAADATTEVNGRSVEKISSHPRFREGSGPPIKDVSFLYLSSIGGPSFVSEVIQIFLRDAERILEQLIATLHAGDVAGFQTHLSSLKDSAAIIGAGRLVELCRSGCDMDQIKVEIQGRSFLIKLQREVDRVIVELERYSPAAS